MSQHHKSTRASVAALKAYRDACAALDLECWICEQPIDYDAAQDDYRNDSRFQRDHFMVVSEHPHLAEDPDNWRPSHAGCNRARSNKAPSLPLGPRSRRWTAHG